MASKTFKIAQLSALLSTHTQKSAYTCAELAIKLHSLGTANSAISTFECNGYKNDYQDKYLNTLSRTDSAAANAYAEKIQKEGAAYCEKRSAQIEKKLSAICKDTGLSIKPCGLSGLIWTIAQSNEFYI